MQLAIKALFLVATLATLGYSKKCGTTTDVDYLLKKPPPGFDITCLSNEILFNFFDKNNGGFERVYQLLDCFDQTIGDCPGGYFRLYNEVRNNVAPGTLRCGNCNAATNRQVRKATQMFQKIYPSEYLEFLRVFQI